MGVKELFLSFFQDSDLLFENELPHSCSFDLFVPLTFLGVEKFILFVDGVELLRSRLQQLVLSGQVVEFVVQLVQLVLEIVDGQRPTEGRTRVTGRGDVGRHQVEIFDGAHDRTGAFLDLILELLEFVVTLVQRLF